ncbi:hypothetical protein DLM19_24260, partial [Salmonella enterica subsp. enterica serovar Agona]|nr:hypothetical protein [Salmonella enterica subsp. enterica serovar Agona]
MSAFGSTVPEWSGATSLELGRYEAVFGGEAVTAIDALPGAIRTLQKHALPATFGSDEANNAIWIGMQDGQRSLTLLYQLQTLRVESVPGPTLRVDYFLSDVWIVDDAF